MSQTRIAHPYDCRALPLWVRVALFAVEHHGRPLGPGELRASLDPYVHRADVSHAIKRAVAAGLLAHDSTARCLYTRVGR